MLRGIVRGDYVLPSPDLGLQLHNRGVKGMVPRSFPAVLLDMLLGFFLPILHAVHSGIMDGVSRNGAKERFKGLWSAITATRATADRQRNSKGTKRL